MNETQGKEHPPSAGSLGLNACNGGNRNWKEGWTHFSAPGLNSTSRETEMLSCCEPSGRREWPLGESQRFLLPSPFSLPE